MTLSTLKGDPFPVQGGEAFPPARLLWLPSTKAFCGAEEITCFLSLKPAALAVEWPFIAGSFRAPIFLHTEPLLRQDQLQPVELSVSPGMFRG